MVRAFPPKQSLDGAPIFVRIEAARKANAGSSTTVAARPSLRMTAVGGGLRFPTLDHPSDEDLSPGTPVAELGWGTHRRAD
jgi:hypothetical protein